MKGANRVIVNTAAQYIRSAINICLSLVSARIILNALGVEDYGIYTLVASTVTLMSFVINALVVTTQRFLSYYSGKQNIDKLKEIFANSLVIHIVFGIGLTLLFEFAGIFLFDGFLKIEPERIAAAKTVFHIVTVSVLLSFITSPFKALLIARENIVYVSVVDVIDAILRLLIALLLISCTYDKLIVYAALLCGVSVLNLFLYVIYDIRSYKECVLPRRDLINLVVMKEMGSFATWTIYSLFCITGRTQGVAIIINRSFGLVMNAAYGIGMQVHNSLAFLSQSVANALNPQIMKAEGTGDRQKMLRLSEVESKLCFMLLSMFVVPAIIEMPALLKFWLGNPPQYSVYFCRALLISTLLDQLTIGLGAANQAVGKIRNYSLIVNTVKFLTIPSIIVALYFFDNHLVIMTLYVLFELVCAVIRLIFLKRTAGLSVKSFVRNVFAKEILPLALLIEYCMILTRFVHLEYRFILTLLTAPVVYAVLIYIAGLCPDEKEVVDSLFKKLKKTAQKVYGRFVGRFFPRLRAASLYYAKFGVKIDWKHPRNLNEKINWLKFHGDTSQWSILADKYAVRNYVASKGYADTLVKLYGVWDKAEDIEWDSLPARFILKVNNGSGDAIICRDKARFDINEAAKKLDLALNLRFGIDSAEPHYLRISPKIIAEELLDAERQEVESTSLVDYKIWCINGKPECVWVVANRMPNTMQVMTYDTQWNPHPEYSLSSEHYALMDKVIPCPKNFDYMLRIASELSSGHPQMRVDLYEVAGKVYFGELTLTSACGLMDYFTPEYLQQLGAKVKLS